MFDPMKDFAAKRADPSVRTANLAQSQLSDSADLATAAKAFEVTNTGTTNAKVKYTPIGRADLADLSPVTITVLAGSTRVIDAGAKRFWLTSSDLSAGLTAGTLEVLLHLE